MKTLCHVTTIPLSLMFIEAQVEPMRAAGFEIEVVSSPGPRLDSFAERHGVVARAVRMQRAISPVADARAVAAMTTLFRTRRPDIVHAHTPKAGMVAMMAATAARVPARVYGMRGLLTLTASGVRRRAFWAAERTACQLAHAVVCEGPSLRRAAIAQGLVSPAKAHVMACGGNGVDAEGHFDPDRWATEAAALRDELQLGDGPILGFVGRLVRDKGVGELVRAWRRLRSEFPTAHLLLVGPRELRDALDDEVDRQIRGDPRIHEVGMVDEAAPYYALMDVFALPSHREGLPNVVLEASAMRVPVVVARSTGCVDAVDDGRTGTLVETGSVADLERALRRYLTDEQLRLEHGRRGRTWVAQRFHPGHVHRALVELYARVPDLPAPSVHGPGRTC